MTSNPFKTFQPFFNKCANGTLPILGNVRVKDNTAMICDLDTWVTFPVSLDDGYYDLRMNQPIFVSPLNGDYPVAAAKTPFAKATIKAGLITMFAACTGTDLLRPVMSGIFVDALYIAATDAHVLRYESHFTKSIDPLFATIIPTVQPLLAQCKLNPDYEIPVTIMRDGDSNRNYGNIEFAFPDCTITTREVEGNYPKFLSVVPNWKKEKLNYLSLPVATVSEMAKTAKAFDHPLLTVSKSGMTIANADLKLEKKWALPAKCSAPKREPDGLLMPMELKSGEHGDAFLGFSPVRLMQITPMFKGNIVIGYYNPVRPMAIWLEPAASVIVGAAKQSPRLVAMSPLRPVIASAAKQPAVVPVPSDLVLVHYSKKAVAIFGDTKPIKDTLLTFGGRFNPHLQYNSRRMAGWVFPKKSEPILKQFLAS